MDGLIRRCQTGSPRELAKKLGVSESTVYRILRGLRDMGLPIEYNELKNSYIYTTNVSVSIQIIRSELSKSKGGVIFFAHCQILTVTTFL